MSYASLSDIFGVVFERGSVDIGTICFTYTSVIGCDEEQQMKTFGETGVETRYSIKFNKESCLTYLTSWMEQIFLLMSDFSKCIMIATQ